MACAASISERARESAGSACAAGAAGAAALSLPREGAAAGVRRLTPAGRDAKFDGVEDKDGFSLQSFVEQCITLPDDDEWHTGRR